MTVTNYTLNHPKAYIGYMICLDRASNRLDADQLCDEYVSGATDESRRGAMNLGLIERIDSEYVLTEAGQTVADEAPERFGVDDQDAVLDALDDLRGGRKRFIEAVPGYEDVGPELARADPTMDQLAEVLIEHQRATDDEPISTAECFMLCYKQDEQFAFDLFIRDTEAVRGAVRGTLAHASFDDLEETPMGRNEAGSGALYRSGATYQMASVGWHLGLFTSKGKQANQLDGMAEFWAIEPEVYDS